ncbi:rod shape-determining protein MreC [Pseudanabaena sp. PCC 6802]|uniref:rod shape-determining protein MreC n=1 Tax=Pseudanabaena sp. PCC 6802 TaxID=118173 RepID=UPI00034933C2|nr:rod shape-determining protein MreC [Pseudanabaena sp. PCC 6802]
MESIRRWWERYRLQVLLASLGLAIAWAIRQTQGVALMEIYQLLSRPFQFEYSDKEVLANAQIRELQYRITEIENQNRQLKALLGTKSRLAGRGIWSSVIGRSGDSWWQQIVISRGSSDGINIGALVVGPGGLVGRVASVSPNSSRVLLISDPTSQVGVTISRTRSMGVLHGQAQDLAILEFFDRDPGVKPGDIVLTSPFSSMFPAGIPVGRIKSVNLDKQPAPEAQVEFSVPMGPLEFVRVYPYTESVSELSNSEDRLNPRQ